jgi:hypothetical protein
MAVYKVIQDIEADDKLLGPLTLRQFVYAGITVFCLYLSYFAISKGAAFMLVVFLPPAILAGFFAFPWGREQPTEIWALARIRFMFKPRKRIWNQTGVKELVTITAPKKIEKIYTDGLSQTEVKSRLQALATTIDSRGWAIKSAAMSPYTTTPVVATMSAGDDRLLTMDSMLQAVPNDDATMYDDVLDAANNPKAQQFDAMLEQNAQAQRERLVSQMQQTTPQATGNATLPQPQNKPADYWFLNQPQQQTVPSGNTTFGSDVVTPGTPTNTQVPTNNFDEQALVDQLRSKEQGQQMQYSHLPTILPLAEQEKLQRQAQESVTTSTQDTPVKDTAAPVTPEPDTAILELATKDDWNISTIARQAKKAHGEEPDEVVISLH